MNLSISMQSLKNVFRFPFHDPRWQNKILIGSLLSFANFIIPIVPALPLMGYLARVLRAGARNDEPAPLPEWDDWGDLFIDGLRMFGVTFITMLPAGVIMFIGWVVYMIGVIPMSTARNSFDSNTALGPFFISLAIFMLSMAVGMLLSLVALVVMPPAVAHVAVRRRFSAVLEFGKWWGILRANLLGFAVAIGIFFGLYMLIMFLTQILYMTVIFCCLIPFVLTPLGVYGGIVLYRLIGQAYGEAAPGEAVAAQVPPAPPAPAPYVPTAPVSESPVSEPPASQPPAAAPESFEETQQTRTGKETLILPRQDLPDR